MDDLKEYVFDIEGDGLNPTKIHCLAVHTKTGVFSTTDYDNMRKCLLSADVLVGHNITRFDIPVLEKLLGITIKARLVDTLALSWYLQPKRQTHNLESYGDDFKIEKPKIDDWENLSIEEYIHRCEEDVRINTHLWNAQWAKLRRIYDTEEDIWRFIDYLTFKMKCVQLQEHSKWKIDLEFTKDSLEKLEKLKEEKKTLLESVMPRIPVYVKKQKPAKPHKKDGSLSAHGQAWVNLLKQYKYPHDAEEIEYIDSYTPPNADSPQQIKDWLNTLGWVPRTFKWDGDRGIPQIYKEHTKELCDSIIELADIEPKVEILAGYSTLKHRIPILRKFLKHADEDGCVIASVRGLSNTLRFKHTDPCVNLPKPEKMYAAAIRAALTSTTDAELCGADMSSLEDRLKQHYIYPYDPEYVKDMMKEDFDPHLDLAIQAKKLSQKDKELYQWFDKLDDEQKRAVPKDKIVEIKKIKATRSIFKNGNYACQYGAGAKRLTLTCNISMDEAKELHAIYWKRNGAIRKVVNTLKVKQVGEEMWLWNPVAKFYYFLKQEKDKFSTLVQGTASYVFDMWVKKIINKRPQLTAQFHDEVVLCVKKNYRESIIKFLTQTIDETNRELNLNRQLDIGIQFGQTYAEIH